MKSFENQTQAYSTWGDKLLQHTDVLSGIQNQRRFRPITIQLAPTEVCDSDCPFCSVQNRPIKEKIPWWDICKGLYTFKRLGAKSVELTGGGNPLLYRDTFNDGNSATISNIIAHAAAIGLKVGIISNSEKPNRHISESVRCDISWLRVSLIKLDEGKEPEDYDFSGFEGKVGLSYIIYEGTTVESIRKIARLVELNPHVKFVRIAADCLTEDSMVIKEKWGEIINEVDKFGKFFIKEIGSNFHAYEGGCWVGMIRPYWTSSGIYICTSHVLIHRTYHPTWRLCGPNEIEETWNRMNERFAQGLPPYDIDIKENCKHCYYFNSNKILSTVINELPDKDFA